MMKKAMEVVHANMALGLTTTNATPGVSTRLLVGMLNHSSKEPSARTGDAPMLNVSSRYSESGSNLNAKTSESQKSGKWSIDPSGVTPGEGVNAALTYLNASIVAKQR